MEYSFLKDVVYTSSNMTLCYLSIDDPSEDEKLGDIQNLYWHKFYNPLRLSKEKQETELKGEQLLFYDALLERLRPLKHIPPLNFDNIVNGSGWLTPAKNYR